MIFDFIKTNPLFLRIRSRFNFYPYRLAIDITEQCNLKCIFCKRTTREKNGAILQQDMPLEDFENIINNFSSVSVVCIAGGGENIFNKNFIEMIKYSKSKNLDVVIFDNFLLMNRDIANKIIDAETNVVYASIDGATKKTYERLRIGSNFEKVIENVKYFIQAKKDKKSKTPIIKFSYTINKHNVGEIEKFVDLVASLTNGEKTEIEFKRLNVHSEEIQHLQTTVSQETINNANKIAEQLNIKLSWINIPKISLPLQNCARWPMPFISIKGDVFPCCFPSDPSNTFGNLLNQNFKTIWNNKKYKELRKGLREGKTPEFCRKCPIYFQNNEK